MYSYTLHIYTATGTPRISCFRPVSTPSTPIRCHLEPGSDAPPEGPKMGALFWGCILVRIYTYTECKDILGQCVSSWIHAKSIGPKHVQKGHPQGVPLNVFLIKRDVVHNHCTRARV